MALTPSSTTYASGAQHQPGPTQRQRDAANESDLDPAAFLKSVRELSEKREREDAERFRKLEEEVQRGREERAARRAERARSISPEKQSTAVSTPNTRPLSRVTTNASLITSPPVLMTPPSASTTREIADARSDSLKRLTSPAMEPEKPSPKIEDVPEFQGFGSIKRSSTSSQRSSASTATSSHSSAHVGPSATNLARSGTLSWQQRRPTSKLASSRPISVAAVDSSASNSRGASVDESEQSRESIAASLGSRDPSWFKQTADRGIGNAAYRKSKDESTVGDTSSYTSRRGLPGPSRNSSVDHTQRSGSPMSESRASDVTSRKSQRESALSSGSRFSTASSTTSGKPDLKSLIAEDEGQRRVSPSYRSSRESASATSPERSSMARTSAISDPQARFGSAMERPISPTKGMGGFVQSAMMKRSDSQVKRWSAQPGTGLSRNNSVASGHSGLQGSSSMPHFEPTPASKETTPEARSRPTSSSNSNLPALNTKLDDELGSMKPTLARHSRSKSVASFHSTANDDGALPASPGSPTKRFSPTKSSWLESSLTKPESPKQLAPAKNNQPSWMADLASRKAQRASGDSTPLAGNPLPSEIDLTKPLSRPGSPLKTSQSPFGPSLLRRSDSRDAVNSSPTGSPSLKSKSTWATDKFSGPPTASSLSSARAGEGRQPAALQSAFEMQPAPVLEKREEPTQEIADPVKEPQNNTSKPLDVPSVASEKTQDISTNGMDLPTFSTSQETPSTPTQAISRSRAKSIKAPSPSKPEPSPNTASKAPVDFRSQLKSRPAPEAKTGAQPEFLSKFGNLRKTQPEKYVAPDTLKDNIIRGKSGLAVTDGPVKTERKDELKESLLSKKEDIKKAKEEGRDLPGQAHERRISSEMPQPPAKPEALAKRELLGRTESARSSASIGREREATPEALARHKSMKQNPVVDVQTKDRSSTISARPEDDKLLVKTVSAPSAVETQQPISKLAARFNPGLAGILARGPPSSTPSRTESPAVPTSSSHGASSEQSGDASQLQDIRKDRARGPKRKKGSTKTELAVATTSVEPEQATDLLELQSPQATITGLRSPPTPSSPNFSRPRPGTPTATSSHASKSTPIGPLDGSLDNPDQIKKSKPQALPGSAASVLTASLRKTPTLGWVADESSKPTTPIRSAAAGLASNRVAAPASPALAAKPSMGFDKPASPALSSKRSMGFNQPAAASTESTSVPEFKGFGSMRGSRASQAKSAEADKENNDEGSPTGKPSAAIWGRRPGSSKGEAASSSLLSTKRDEEAAMRSAGLLASVSPNGTGDRMGTPSGSVGLPPRPGKSSRMVSGQLAESSPNKGPSTSSSPVDERPETEAGRLLQSALGCVPKIRGQLALNTTAIISSQASEAQDVRNPRKTVSVVYPDGSSKVLPPQEEYTVFDESVFLCTHFYTNPRPAKVAEVYIWAGETAFGTTIDAANVHAKRIARENSTTAIYTVIQGQESPALLQAFGGIFITRRGSRETATKQYMLCGRKHLGHIVFDEVDFDVSSLCHGFVYLISYPVTLQETRLYLWKGSGCSTEELSGARLAAMDLSETGEIIEVDGGVEFASFLKIFSPTTTKAHIAKPSPLWQLKAQAPDKFQTRLFRVQQPESRPSLLTSIWNRRPSWNRLSPARTGSPVPNEVKVEAKEISPFTQSSLEAEGIYLLDAHGALYILIGVLVPSQAEKVRSTLFAQTVLFAQEYAKAAAEVESRTAVPSCQVVISGVLQELKMLFRHWDEGRGLWGTAGLMAGSRTGEEGLVRVVALEDALAELSRD
ncbi:hypothetical protein TI39_contig303g00022 [Zymoseptoria brevis]|uniref:DUF4045 domain-containing protein n=1 Tax=Zymoseptoria brevis TaxID=1047168 RepID=A0A0F4GY31_9PEZI|nr:hypothetical protein TI39_contig303g00022 [Zymoseptoria brevis]